VDCAKALLDAGASVVDVDKAGNTLLHLAVYDSNAPDHLITLLLDTGASLNAVNNAGELPFGGLPIHAAIRAKRHWLAAIIIQGGADVAIVDKEGNSQLHLTVIIGAPDHLITLLLDAGALLNAVNEAGDMPLHIAIKEKRYESATILMTRGADVTAVDKDGNSPLHLAAKYKTDGLAALLVEMGAPLDAANRAGEMAFGDKPLHAAINDKFFMTSIALVKRGADVTAVDKVGTASLPPLSVMHTDKVISSEDW
jgi:ankyrin repeat protein